MPAMISRTLFPRLLRPALPLLAAFLSLACHSTPKPPPTLAQQITSAHTFTSRDRRPTLQGLLLLQMESHPLLEARFVCETSTNRIRLDLPDKTAIVFDGSQTWISPASSPLQHARSTHLAYPRLIALPFLLQSPNATLTDLGPQPLGSATYAAARLTLGSPDDWYTLYTDPKTHRIEAIVYSTRLADPPARAVTFYSYKTLGEAQLPTEWKFWKWHTTEGIYGPPLGTARLLDLTSTGAKAPLLARPPNSRPEQ